MRARFSESSFAFAFVQQLCNRWRQHIIGFPEFPSQISEGRPGGGYDARLESENGFIYLMQFKRCEYMKWKTARESACITPPYFRFQVYGPKRSHQHQLLIDHEYTKSELRWRQAILYRLINREIEYIRSEPYSTISKRSRDRAIDSFTEISRYMMSEFEPLSSMADLYQNYSQLAVEAYPCHVESCSEDQILDAMTAKDWNSLSGPFSRNLGSSEHHSLLMALAAIQGNVLVEYVAPLFVDKCCFKRHYEDEGDLFERVIRVTPSSIPSPQNDNDHYVVCDKSGGSRGLCSEFQPLSSPSDWGEITSEGFARFPRSDEDIRQIPRERDNISLQECLSRLGDNIAETFGLDKERFGSDVLSQCRMMSRLLLGAELLVVSLDDAERRMVRT